MKITVRFLLRAVIGCYAFIGTALFIAHAYAADLPSKISAPATPPSLAGSDLPWTGFYIGGFGGYEWSDGRKVPVTGTAFGDSVLLKTNGGLIGLTGGYDLQFDRFIAGALGDFSWRFADKNVTSFATASLAQGNALAQVYSNWQKVATARARAGFLVTPSVLVYATGGLAWGEPGINIGLLQSQLAPVWSAHYGGWRTGWAAGGGVEWKIFDNLSAKAEFLRIDLGRVHSSFAAIDPTGASTIAQASYHAVENRVTVGLNWRFGGFGFFTGNPQADFGLPAPTGNIKADASALRETVKSKLGKSGL